MEAKLYSKSFKDAEGATTTFTTYISQGKLEYLAKKAAELAEAADSEGARIYLELGESSDGVRFDSDLRISAKAPQKKTTKKFVSKKTFSKRA